MANLQQQINALFDNLDPSVQEVIMNVLRIEQDNIHLDRPRFKEPILDVLSRIVNEQRKGAKDED